MKFPVIAFTKPWDLPGEKLVSLVQSFGLSGVELPVRPNYHVNPDNIDTTLPALAKLFRKHDLKIQSIAIAPRKTFPDERIISACSESDIALIRTNVEVDPTLGYLEVERRTLKSIEKIAGHLEKYRVKLLLQNHSRDFVGTALGLLRLLEPFGPDLVGAMWDPGHSALSGEPPDQAVDILEKYLAMVSLKNAIWKKIGSESSEETLWDIEWTNAHAGLAHWTTVRRELDGKNWNGPLSLHAEYSQEKERDKFFIRDIAFLKKIFG